MTGLVLRQASSMDVIFEELMQSGLTFRAKACINKSQFLAFFQVPNDNFLTKIHAS